MSRNAAKESHRCVPVAIIAVMVLAAPACGHQTSDDRQLGRQSDTPHMASGLTLTDRQGSLAGPWFGVTEGADPGHAEFLHLSSEGSGSLYDAGGWIRICAWRAARTGVLSFRTAETYGRVFAFEGTTTNDGFRGRLRILEGAGAERLLGEFTFSRVTVDETAQRRAGAREGVFSNVRYAEESGDLAGADLFVLTVDGELKVALALVSGAPAAPFVPRRYEFAGDTLSLRVGPPGDQGTDYTAVLGAEEALLWAGDVRERAAGANVRRLKRRHSVAAFFSQQPTGTCPDS